MICDLAETYGILDYKGLSLQLVATLVLGLRDNSRVKMKLSGTRIDIQTALLASACDELSFLSWSKTKDAQKNRNKPKSRLQALMGEPKKNSDVVSFDTADEWEAARQRIINRR